VSQHFVTRKVVNTNNFVIGICEDNFELKNLRYFSQTKVEKKMKATMNLHKINIVFVRKRVNV